MTTQTAKISIQTLPRRYFAYVRNIGPYMGDTELFGRLFHQVIGWLNTKDLMQPGMEAISIYHDHPEEVPPEKYRISVGFTIPKPIEGEDDIQVMEIPEGRYAVGSFEILPTEYGNAWEEMMHYLQDKKLMPSGGPMYESYKNDPKEHPEGKHLVDICIAIV
jgi:AraC family transcriptional regulator